MKSISKTDLHFLSSSAFQGRLPVQFRLELRSLFWRFAFQIVQLFIPFYDRIQKLFIIFSGQILAFVFLVLGREIEFRIDDFALGV